jgi:hypothetical protein
MNTHARGFVYQEAALTKAHALQPFEKNHL